MVKMLTSEISISKKYEKAALVLGFSLIMFLTSMIKIYTPVSPVPFTLQTFALFMAVYFLDIKELGLSQMIYIAAGLIGIPVFAAGISGAFALVGPTAGYLIGFIAAGMAMAYLKKRFNNPGFAGMAAIYAAGTIIIYACGAAHLCLVYGMTLKNAVMAGIAPFVIADAAKITAASAFNKAGK